MLTDKLADTGTSIFTIMSALSQKYSALNLAQGFPNFTISENLQKLVTQAMKEDFNQYAPMAGNLLLRERIAEKQENLYHHYYHPSDEVTITAGATQAIFTTIATTVEPLDEVIIFKPAYDCYEPTIKLMGGVPVTIQLDPEKFLIDWKEVQKKITDKTKLIILNSPHNPTGNTLTSADLQQLENIVKNTDILILSDEVYEHIIFDNKKHLSISTNKSLAERTFIVASFGKTFHVTGWKAGYCLAPKPLMKLFRKVHQFIVFSVHHPTQVALATYLKNSETYSGISAFYERKRDLFLSKIENSKFEFTPTKGTYFQLLNYKKITKELDIDFTKKLIQEHKIGLLPISVFNEPNYKTFVVRCCFAKTDKTLLKAAELLCKI